jgi:hypothetical protein
MSGAGSDDSDKGGRGALMVEFGDASIAAAFTSKSPSVKAVLNILKQGANNIHFLQG